MLLDADQTSGSADARSVIARLPDSQRWALLLVCGQGLSYETAAQALAVPVPALVRDLVAARKALAAASRDERCGGDPSALRPGSVCTIA